MARLLRMPEVAANATEAVLADWSVPENTAFAAQDSLATVETEKALVDVEADQAGVVLKALVPPGSQVEVGAPIAVLGDPGEQVADLDALLAELGVADTPAPKMAERRDVPDPEGGTASTHPSAPPVETAQPAEPVQAAERANGNRVFASPLARKLAKDAGIPVEEIDGTGPRQRILRRDVERVQAARSAAAAPAAGPAALAGAPGDGRPADRERADRPALLRARHGPRRPAGRPARGAERRGRGQRLAQRPCGQGGRRRPHPGPGDERGVDRGRRPLLPRRRHRGGGRD
jgi:pyruvate dehydrogenase E2 component (dihydrolipoamide acetyltransferase)